MLPCESPAWSCKQNGTDGEGDNVLAGGAVFGGLAVCLYANTYGCITRGSTDGLIF